MLKLKVGADSQLVDEVVAEVLRDVFMPRLPHPCSGRGRGRGHGAQVPDAVVHQTGVGRERDDSSTFQPPLTLKFLKNGNPHRCKDRKPKPLLPLRVHAVQHGIRQQRRLLVRRLHPDGAVHSYGVTTWS